MKTEQEWGGGRGGGGGGGGGETTVVGMHDSTRNVYLLRGCYIYTRLHTSCNVIQNREHIFFLILTSNDRKVKPCTPYAESVRSSSASPAKMRSRDSFTPDFWMKQRRVTDRAAMCFISMAPRPYTHPSCSSISAPKRVVLPAFLCPVLFWSAHSVQMSTQK